MFASFGISSAKEFLPEDTSSTVEGDSGFVPEDTSSTVEGGSEFVPEDTSSTVEGDSEFVPEDTSSTVEGAVVTTPEVVEETSNNTGGSTSGSRRSGGGSSRTTTTVTNVPTDPAVLGASTGPNGEMLSCAPYLVTFMRAGQTNNVEEVKKLQTFLNEFNGAKLPVTGFFGPMTHTAVKNLQAKYSNDILKPWDTAGLSTNLQPTGYAYKMTQWFVNTHKCPSSNIPAPVLK